MATTGTPVCKDHKYLEEIQISSTLADTDQAFIDVFIHEDMLHASTTLFTYAMSDGGDIRFCSNSDGSGSLGFRLVEYNAGSSRIRGFVKVPSLSSSGTTSIYMFYGRQDDGQPPASWHEGWNNSISKKCVSRWELATDYGPGRGPAIGAQNYNLTAVGSPSAVSGKIYQCYNYNGSSQYMYSTATAVFSPDKFTVAAWIKADTVSSLHTIMSTENAGFTAGWSLRVYNGKVEMIFYASGAWRVVTSSTTILTDGTWYFVVGTFDGSNLRLYVNASEEGTPQAYSTYTKSNTALYIGECAATGRKFDGYIDEPRFYDFALSQDEIEIIYRMTKDPAGDSYIAGQAPAAFGSGFPALWSKKIKLTQNNAKVASDQTNFTATIAKENLPDDIFDSDGASAQQYGKDIRITSDIAGTTLIPYHVIRFLTDSDPANGECEIKVKIPTLTSATATEIYIWYSASETMEQYPPTADVGFNNAYDSNVLISHDMQDYKEGIFVPTTEGMLGWWKADADCYEDAGTDPCEDGDGVYQWNDQSGNGKNLIQTTAGNRPTYKTNIQNGLPAVRFDGSDDFYNNIALGATGTIAVVLSMDNGDSLDTLISNDADSGDIRRNGTNLAFRGNDNTVAGDFTHDDGTLIINRIYKDAPDGYGTIMVAIFRAETLSSYSTFCLGRASSGLGRYWDGDVLEVIAYDHILGAYEVAKLGAYFEEKYSLATIVESANSFDSAAYKLKLSGPDEVSADFYKGQEFDGSTDYCAYNAGLFNQTSNITLWCYARVDDVTNTNFVFGRQNNNGFSFGIWGGSALVLGVHPVKWYISSAHGFISGNKYFFAVTFSSSYYARFFKNGAFLSQDTPGGAPTAPTGNNYLGRFDAATGDYFDGVLDEFGMDLVARSDDWMTALGENLSDVANFWSSAVVIVSGHPWFYRTGFNRQ